MVILQFPSGILIKWCFNVKKFLLNSHIEAFKLLLRYQSRSQKEDDHNKRFSCTSKNVNSKVSIN